MQSRDENAIGSPTAAPVTPATVAAAGAASVRSALAEGVGRREVWGWAMYDFANSSYTTVVITAVFNAYFVAVVAAGAVWATFAWTATLAASYFVLMLVGPVLGAYADLRARKKAVLLFSTSGCVLATGALYFAGPGALVFTIFMLALSNLFYGLGENLVAAFLPELGRAEGQGKLSGWGWSIGYLGGLLTLGTCLAYITWASGRGQEAQQFVPVTMLITALFFALASLPTFLFLRERATPQPAPSPQGLVRDTFARLAQTWQRARHYLDLRRFLACIVVYQAGVQAVITLAAIYAQQAMGFTTQDTIMLIIVVNLTAAVGAFAFGYVQDRLGHVPTIALTLLGWIGMVVLAWFAQGPALFWVAANLAGVSLGASQSAARAFVSVLSPSGRSAEFFGLWGLANRLASILGPLTYGVVSWVSGGDHRLAMLITGCYFLAGLILLVSIDTERGRRAALATFSS
jgi:UMF1 family MFS transporter